ncbi:MAG: hypothetical protein FJX29_07795 [Alphaproteobacteria bacterium]|nr:hypothetical protein [Alphaproteobacteria bacterium]
MSPPPLPPPLAPSSSGLGKALGAGLASALAVLAAVAGHGWWTRPDPARVAAEQNARIEQAVSAGVARERAGFEQKFQAEREAIAKQAAATGTALAAISQRIAAVEQLAGQAAGAAQEAKGEAQEAKGEAKQAKEAAARPPAVSGPVVDLRPLEARIAALEKRLAMAENTLAAPRETARVTQTQDRDILPPKSPAVEAPAIGPLLAPLLTRLSALEERLAPLAGRFEPIEKRLSPLEQKFAPVEAEIAQARAQSAAASRHIAGARHRADAAAVAVLARGIGDALAASAPYDTLLKGAQALGVDRAHLDALAPFAANGAPPPAVMIKSLALAQTKIPQRKVEKPAAEDGVIERLKRNFWKQVEVRPIDASGKGGPEIPGASESLNAIASALRRNDLAAAVKLADALPAVAAKPLEGWIAQLRQLARAHDAQKAMLAFALARLTQEPAP